jgi:hypothetical protein
MLSLKALRVQMMPFTAYDLFACLIPTNGCSFLFQTRSTELVAKTLLAPKQTLYPIVNKYILV